VSQYDAGMEIMKQLPLELRDVVKRHLLVFFFFEGTGIFLLVGTGLYDDAVSQPDSVTTKSFCKGSHKVCCVM